MAYYAEKREIKEKEEWASAPRIVHHKQMYLTKLLPPGADLTDAYGVRTAVFVNEQGFSSELEIDDIDRSAYHIVMFEGGKPIATGRVFVDSQDKSTYIIGRVAVLKKYRSQGVGFKLMGKLEECAKSLGGTQVVLGAQMHAVPFYEKNGYTAFGEEYMEEHCPHIHMRKTL
ncbi:GNAT family N-acetyltransferase [Ruminococcaceae bacterium OttesenSCG-928-L11]|nr:GNAT family N-acetyltransferase [Ruminococcaceae bacterium OttesenSCG-928-L11]